MDDDNGFHEKEMKKEMEKVHAFAAREMGALGKEIEHTISILDPLELLSQIAIVAEFGFGTALDLAGIIKTTPILHYLTGLFLKNTSVGTKYPDGELMLRVIALWKEYYYKFFASVVSEIPKSTQFLEVGGLIHQAKLQKIIGPISSDKYLFQLNELLKEVFYKFNAYFQESVGFTAHEAVEFGNKIIRDCEEKRNAFDGEVRKFLEKTDKDMCLDSEAPTAKEVFLFDVDGFYPDMNSEQAEKFKRYLQSLGCRFGDGSSDFKTPLDDNLIHSKPIILVGDDRFFCPIPSELISSLPRILQGFFDKEKRRQTRIWHSFERTISKFLEDKVIECFSRLFPEDSVHGNLFYTHNGKECEVDVIVVYDNKVFTIESKSGALTEPSKRGALERLKRDLRNLVEDAYKQGKRVVDYIKSVKKAEFKDKTGKTVMKVDGDVRQTDFFVVSVTLENLLSLATGLRRLHSLNLFAENEYPWSVSIWDLDIITRHLTLPAIFTHYLEQRLAAQDEDALRAFDELSLLSYYLKNGNFFLLKQEPISEVVLDGSWLQPFDDYYIRGGAHPKLTIEPDLIRIIKVLEKLRPHGYSSIVSALLDFPHDARRWMLKNLTITIRKAKNDKQLHDYTEYFPDYSAGISFIAHRGEKGVRRKLQNYCLLKKYQMKANRWIGICTDILDKNWYVNGFVLADFPWEKDAEMEKAMKTFVFEKWKTES